MTKIFLSVVIPTYNEESFIGETIATMVNFLASKPYSFEIIVSDDGSSDKTLPKVKAAAQVQSKLRVLSGIHQGKGAAVKRGVLAAQGKFILFADADLSTPIEELDKLLQSLQVGRDVAIGSRALGASEVKVHQPIWREKLGQLFNWFVQLLVFKGINDTQCGFKMFKRQAALDLFKRQRLEGFIFDVEILYLAKKLGYSVTEVAVPWSNRAASKVSVTKELLGVIFDLLKIRFLHAKERTYAKE